MQRLSFCKQRIKNLQCPLKHIFFNCVLLINFIILISFIADILEWSH